MSPGLRHTAAHTKNMAILFHASQSSSTDTETEPEPLSVPALDSQHRRDGSMTDMVTTMIYEPAPSTATILRASQVTPPPDSVTSLSGTTASRGHLSDRELAFVITAALFGMGVLLLGASIAHLMRRRRRPFRGADTQEQGLGAPRDFDDSTWGTRADEKRSRFEEYLAAPPRLPTPPPSTSRLSFPDVASAPTEDIQTPNTELTAILEQFEHRLHQEETDIALALHMAFGDELSGTRHCAPFLAGSEDDVTTMMSLQAGMECVGKRVGGIRNRARQGSDASASSQSTTVTVEGFSSNSSSASSLTSIESMMSDIDESSEEDEEDVVYEVKRAQTRSMEIQKGKLISWQPGGVQLMVTSPSTTTLETASSSLSVDLDQFPLPP
ncbi:hypothetical protein DFH07DRAFT_845353 [Mycena maculata]|uniref:Transmembrane protein n=1 Tax=Mycena maculata TaxID=230809 RepID=A0AAD7I3M6_9AGAR|nr:hypothetical protein DFH07DRAFT_845353 [Mycena maculata]